MKAFKTIRTRLLIVPAAAILAVVVTAGIGLYGLSLSHKALAEAATATKAVLYSKQADMMHDALRGDVLVALLAGPSASLGDRAAVTGDMDAHVASFEDSISSLLALDLTPEAREAVLGVSTPLAEYIAQARALVPLALASSEKANLQLPQFQAAFGMLEISMEDLGQRLESLGSGSSEAESANAQFLVLALSVWGVLSTAAFLLVTWIVSRGITVPIGRVSDAMKEVGDGKLDLTIVDINDSGEVGDIARSLDGLRDKLAIAATMADERQNRQVEQQRVTEALSVGLKDLAAGNFTRPILIPFADEHEMLRRDFNLTVDKLSDAISRVANAAESIRSRAAEVDRAIDDLARRTETQAATLEETAAAMDEMTNSVKSSTGSTKEVEAIVSRARNEAEASGAVVKGAVAAMVEIEKSSNQISQIIGVIDDIAFQTNLLALNAGVEAARAGDAGRGFAVVASEVGALAQRSSVAAKEIKSLISASTQHVGIGVDQVGQAGGVLNSIVDRVTQISTLVSNIATGAEEQSTGLGEINIGVNQLDLATQQNAAMVEETTAASQLLSLNANDLTDLMSMFVVGGNPSHNASNVIEMARPSEVQPIAAHQRSTTKAPREVAAFAANGTSVWTDV
jgi:methyl-accepting chemotaxis protein